jgi:hypothetical protein
VISVYANFILCGAIFWTCFCRLVRTDCNTYLPVRVAFMLLAGVALVVGVAPLGWVAPCLPAEPPGVAQLALEAAMFTVQGLTARYWRDGVPCHFQRDAGGADHG